MKNILILILFLSINSYSQNGVLKQFQKGDFVYVYDSTAMTASAYSSNGIIGKMLINGNARFATQLYDGTIYFQSTLGASNVLDTLNTSTGTIRTGICRITIPNTINTQRIIQYENNCIIFSTATYSLQASDTSFLTFPLKIIRKSDNKVMCIVNEFGKWDWCVQIQWSWLGVIGTTRLKRITLP